MNNGRCTVIPELRFHPEGGGGGRRQRGGADACHWSLKSTWINVTAFTKIQLLISGVFNFKFLISSLQILLKLPISSWKWFKSVGFNAEFRETLNSIYYRSIDWFIVKPSFNKALQSNLITLIIDATIWRQRIWTSVH